MMASRGRYFLMFTAVVAVLAAGGASAAPASMKINSLPGYDDPIPFDQYSGYVTVDEAAGRNLFFWFVESENNPSTDPLVVWLTGGPGCSSLLALLTEHGPFQVNPDDCTQLMANPYSWNKVANVIYVESPAGVGFSYTKDGNYTTGDDATAKDNYAFMKGFMELFPEYKSNPFYVTGESYAGHYVPELTQLIYNDGSFNLKGFAVGNPSFDFAIDGKYYWEFMYWHALIGTQEYAAATKACDGNFHSSDPSAACKAALAGMRKQVIGITPYNIYYPCIGEPSINGGCLTESFAELATGVKSPADLGSQTFVPCVNLTAPRTYLNQDVVRTALHVVPESLAWRVCSQVVNYTSYGLPSMAPYYHNMSHTLDILVYSGDVDSCVPYPGTEENVDLLDYPISDAWHQWHYDGQIAGYVKSYKTGNKLRFLTIKDAGHMVATYKPAQALAFFTRYVQGTPF